MFTWSFCELLGRLDHDYWPQFFRSFLYAATATMLAMLIAYPLAYTIAFKVRPSTRPILLVLIIAPFFTSFLIRTLAWTTVLADDGIVVSLPAQHRFLMRSPT